MVGYLLEQELGRHLGSGRVATVLTQVEVSAQDPAFQRPTKPIGPVYDDEAARRLAADRGWTIAADGDGWRRVVASREPRRIVELETIRLLVRHGVIVVCAGGGGIPVVPEGRGGFRGVEAVIDKDLAAALLAIELGADKLVLLTDVDGIYEGWGTDYRGLIRTATPAMVRRLPLAAGSMRPKAEAVARFVEAGGRLGAIGSLAEAVAVARGDAGTSIRCVRRQAEGNAA